MGVHPCHDIQFEVHHLSLTSTTISEVALALLHCIEQFALSSANAPIPRLATYLHPKRYALQQVTSSWQQAARQQTSLLQQFGLPGKNYQPVLGL